VGLAAAAVVGLVLSSCMEPDKGVRVFLLNHAPDEVVVINPQTRQILNRFPVADGLTQIVFSHDGRNAYIANVVDVTNKVTVLDPDNLMKKEIIEVDGIPQGVDVFPDDKRLAIINAAKTDFQSGGFDVIDLTRQSPSDPSRKLVTYRERSLRLVNKLHVSADGLKIYCIDAKSDKIWVFDVAEKKLIKTIELATAPIDMYFPKNGPYFYSTSIKSQSLYVIDRKTDDVVRSVKYGRFRYVVTSPDGLTVYAPMAEMRVIAVIDANAGKVVDTIPLPRETEIIDISPYADELYMVGRHVGDFFIVNIKQRKITAQIPLGGEFRDIAVRPIPRLEDATSN
jgi:DNA-binding beta-propeller fold protein YncE